MALIENNLIESINVAPNPLLQCMVVVTATELCGSFLTGKTGRGEARNNFLTFWKSEYVPKIYHDMSNLLWESLRNGVSHSFVAKRGVIPSGEEKSSDKHLKPFKNGVFIYAPQLKKDIVAGLLALSNDIKKNKDNLATKRDCVMKKLEEDGEKAYVKYIGDYKIKVLDEEIIGDIYPDTLSVKRAQSQDIMRTTGSAVATASIAIITVVDQSALQIDLHSEK